MVLTLLEIIRLQIVVEALNLIYYHWQLVWLDQQFK